MNRRNYEPNYEAALALVRHLDNDELKSLVNDDDAVAEIVKNAEQCKYLETEKDFIMTQNKSLAEYNLSLAPKLEKGKSKLKDLYDNVQEVYNSVQDKQSQISKRQMMKSSLGEINSDTALALLQTAAAESEEESENIADKFYQKELDIDEFLEQFQTVRKQMHLRRVKADKMKDLLLKKQGNSSVNGPSRPPPVVPYPVGPYPVGAINMPYFPMAK